MKMIPRCNSDTNPNKKVNLVSCIVVFLLTAVAFFALLSFECHLEPELVKIVRLDPACFPDESIYEPWHTVYEAYDNCPGTWIHPHEYYQSRAIDDWPEMDLENYTYIITYCQKIQSLGYYWWKENNIPTYTGAKEAHLILEETIEPLTIYIYRIPKMRINNPAI